MPVHIYTADTTYEPCEEDISGIDLDSLPPLLGRPLYGWRKLHYLNDFVRTILGLSVEETAVLEAVRGFQMPRTAAKIAVVSGVSRKNTNRILQRFRKRQLVRFFPGSGARDRWAYNRKLSRLLGRH